MIPDTPGIVPDATAPLDGGEAPEASPGICSSPNASGGYIQASNYDQSCKSDFDCIAVGEGYVCNECTLACGIATINAGARAQYLAAFAGTPAGDGGFLCGCPEFSGPCCLGGTCQVGFQCIDDVVVGTADGSAGPPPGPTYCSPDAGPVASCTGSNVLECGPLMPFCTTASISPTWGCCSTDPVADGTSCVFAPPAPEQFWPDGGCGCAGCQ